MFAGPARVATGRELEVEPEIAAKPQPFWRSRALTACVAVCAGFASLAVCAQPTIAPYNCRTSAVVFDDGDDRNGSSEDSLAVGCGAEVSQTHTNAGSPPVAQPLFTLDAGNNGRVDAWLVLVDCTDSSMGICDGRTGNQLVSIGRALYNRLHTVGANPLTSAEVAALSEMLGNENNVRPLGDIVLGHNYLASAGAQVWRAGSVRTNEVNNATALGQGAAVRADGGIAIGNGATVGSHLETTVTRTMDSELGVLVVGFDETTTGRGGENGIAIGNGARATGRNSIAIGAGARATREGQVVIGSYDIGAMASSVADHGRRLDAHAAGISDNALRIAIADERIDDVAAAAAALSAVPNAPGQDERIFIGIGVGSHRGQSSVAAGLSGRVGANRNIVLNAGVANSGAGTSSRAGIGWSF